MQVLRVFSILFIWIEISNLKFEIVYQSWSNDVAAASFLVTLPVNQKND